MYVDHRADQAGIGDPGAVHTEPTVAADLPTGVQPFSMKKAVMNPQAMNAAMFGMIIPDRNVPNFWTAIRVPPVLDCGCRFGHCLPFRLGQPDAISSFCAVAWTRVQSGQSSRHG